MSENRIERPRPSANHRPAGREHEQHPGDQDEGAGEALDRPARGRRIARREGLGRKVRPGAGRGRHGDGDEEGEEALPEIVRLPRPCPDGVAQRPLQEQQQHHREREPAPERDRCADGAVDEADHAPLRTLRGASLAARRQSREGQSRISSMPASISATATQRQTPKRSRSTKKAMNSANSMLVSRIAPTSATGGW